MTKEHIHKTTLDINDRTIFCSDELVSVFVYDRSTEPEWGSVYSSWYNDPSMPNDTFINTVGMDDRWAFFEEYGSVEHTIASGIEMTISGAKARGGFSSESLWTLSGDFDIKLYIDEDLYYNEYRSSASVGLVLSKDDSNKLKLSRFFDIDTPYLGYSLHTVSGVPLKYFGWEEEVKEDVSIRKGTSSINLIRSGNSITAKYGYSDGYSTLISGVDSSFLGDSVYVSIELETDQYNVFGCGIAGISISGTVSSSTSVFEKELRGPSKPFPSKSIVLSDVYGISVLDSNDASLWARFPNVESFDYTCTSGVAVASNGKIYSTTLSGCAVIDFVSDSAYLYTIDGKWVKEGTLDVAGSDTYCSFSSVANPYIRSPHIYDLSSNTYGAVSYCAVGSSAGLSLFSDDSLAYASTSGSVDAVFLDDDGTLWWHEYDSVDFSSLLYTKSNYYNCSGSFSADSYYTVGVNGISAQSVNDIYAAYGYVSVAHNGGIDLLGNGPTHKYGYSLAKEAIVDGAFDDFIGVHWFVNTNSFLTNYVVLATDNWTGSGNAVKIGFYGTYTVFAGTHVVVQQATDLSNIDTMYFDAYIENTNGVVCPYSFVVMIDNDIVYSKSISLHSESYYNQSIDVHSYEKCSVSFGLYSTDSFTPTEDVFVYFSNITTMPISYTDKILSTNLPVIGSKIVGSTGALKLFYVVSDGYGCVDLQTHTEDFFDEHGYDIAAFDVHKI